MRSDLEARIRFLEDQVQLASHLVRTAQQTAVAQAQAAQLFSQGGYTPNQQVWLDPNCGIWLPSAMSLTDAEFGSLQVDWSPGSGFSGIGSWSGCLPVVVGGINTTIFYEIDPDNAGDYTITYSYFTSDGQRDGPLVPQLCSTANYNVTIAYSAGPGRNLPLAGSPPTIICSPWQARVLAFDAPAEIHSGPTLITFSIP